MVLALPWFAPSSLVHGASSDSIATGQLSSQFGHRLTTKQHSQTTPVTTFENIGTVLSRSGTHPRQISHPKFRTTKKLDVRPQKTLNSTATPSPLPMSQAQESSLEPPKTSSTTLTKKMLEQSQESIKLINLCTYPESDKNRWFDKTQKAITRSVCRQAIRFDRFFGDVRNEDDYKSSFVRVRNALVASREDNLNFRFRPRLRARIYLPQVREKLNLIIVDDSSSKETTSSAQEVVPENTQESNRYSAALRWVVESSSNLQLDFDIGARFDNNIQTFLRWRYRNIMQLTDDSQAFITNTTFWRDPIGFGNTVAARVERTLSKKLLFQWANEFTFSENSQGVDWGSRVTFYQRFNDTRAISYTAGLNGHTRPLAEIDSYGLSVRYRQQFIRDWLFWEFEPALNWPLERDRKLTPQATFRLEVQFRQL